MRRVAAPLIPVSWGELLDKITILEIKIARLLDPAARANVKKELEELQRVASPVTRALEYHLGELRAINEHLWDIEDAIRTCEARSEFGSDFVRLAREVYRTNDQRAAIKRQLNLMLASDLIEEKSYAPYAAAPHTDAAMERPLAEA